MTEDITMDKATEHPACGAVIYLTPEQCEHFWPGNGSKHYYAKGKPGEDGPAWVGYGDALLASNPDYDEAHRSVLEPIKECGLVLRRFPAQMPGWYTIILVGRPRPTLEEELLTLAEMVGERMPLDQIDALTPEKLEHLTQDRDLLERFILACKDASGPRR